ncbi:helix-turn-helix domain-containing protein [Streptomyces sp. NPDC048045]|uniref:IclR family transcriptional regulator n=1 Tax=Streptomyces sp. NPDC048045 TaxID=3154710 RepID=UPI0034454A5F
MSTATQPRRTSGVGVLDKAATLLDIVEGGPASLGDLVTFSGLPRPTVHRLAIALERHGLLTRDRHGRWVLGPRLDATAIGVHHDRLAMAAGPVLAELHTMTGLDARLYRRRDGLQICVAASVDPSGRPAAVPVGSIRPASVGPIAQVLLAWAEPDELYQGLTSARFTAAQLTVVRRRGWAYGPDAVPPGSVSYAVPVCAGDGRIAAALALTGPAARMPEAPTRRLGGAMFDAVAGLTDALLRLRPDFQPV